jgi:hypothetical protein
MFENSLDNMRLSPNFKRSRDVSQCSPSMYKASVQSFSSTAKKKKKKKKKKKETGTNN